jgi:hypothetical protein
MRVRFWWQNVNDTDQLKHVNVNGNDKDKGKSKVHPKTCHEGIQGEYRLSSTLSLFSALDSVGWSTPRAGRFTQYRLYRKLGGGLGGGGGGGMGAWPVVGTENFASNRIRL